MNFKRCLFIFTVLLLSVVLGGCNFFVSTGEEPDNKTPIVTIQPLPKSPDKILFAHGYHDNASAWDTFYNYMGVYHPDWGVYRTNTDPKGSIEKRGGELADYINSLDLEDNSLICVGHSMGGA